MNKENLLKVLVHCQKNTDAEIAHTLADEALLLYIGDEEITTAYGKISKWYA